MFEAIQHHHSPIRVLVLNRLWQPVNIVGIRRAVSLLFQDHASVIHPVGGHYEILSAEQWLEDSMANPPRPHEASVRSIKFALRAPQILLLKEYDRVPVQETKLNRRSIFERDEFRCQYCGEVFAESHLNIDHVIPRDKGGVTSWENVVTSCIDCNSRKANRVPHQAGMAVRRQPRKPRWRPFVSQLHRDNPVDVWAPFVEKQGGDRVR